MTATATREKAAPAAPAKKKSILKSKLMIVVLVVLLGGGGGAYFLLNKPAKAGPPTGGDYVALDAATVNLADGHYLKVGISLQLVAGKASATSFNNTQAEALVVSEFSDRTVASLSSNAARQAALTDLQTKLNKAYPGEIFTVYITQFVSQ